MARVILHSDLNSFYASVECLYDPSLRNIPVSVCGSVEDRHGIILASNQLAKKFGIKTGEVVWQAKQKCPQLHTVQPNFQRYLRHSVAAKAIYQEYSPCVESFGLDECWIDLTGTGHLFGSGEQVAQEIRKRVLRELGITCSIGVSFNKIFAKLGSDMKKPNAVTVLSPNNFREKVWPLPARELLYIGPATSAKLAHYGIYTIGDLAQAQSSWLENRLGKWGHTLWSYANGYDYSPVSEIGVKPPPKSVGNSTTTPKNLCAPEDLQITVMLLAESVAERMREKQLKCRVLQVSVRLHTLDGWERQETFPFPCSTAETIGKTALELILRNWDRTPIRAVGIRGTSLIQEEYPQLSLIPEVQKEQKREQLEEAVQDVRRRYGHFVIQRGMMLVQKDLSNLDTRSKTSQQSTAFYK